jgi:Arabinose efflux permease
MTIRKSGGIMKQKKQTNVALTTAAIFIATFMAAIEGTIVSTAMPTIIGSLNGIALMNWVFSIYLLTSSIATPIYGKLSDRIGRKPVFIVGIVIFLVGSTLAGLSHTMLTLILARALQGIGAGAIQPVTFTMIADIYPYEKRAKVLGLNGSAWGIASIIAPLLGGYIVQHLSWHWIFFINIPVGVITLLLAIFFFHEDREAEKAPIDVWGSATLSVFLLALMLFAQGLGTASNLWLNALWLVLAAVAGWGFVVVEKKATDPLIPLKLFKNNLFLGQNIVAALVSGVLIGFEVYIPCGCRDFGAACNDGWFRGHTKFSHVDFWFFLGWSLVGFDVGPTNRWWQSDYYFNWDRCFRLPANWHAFLGLPTSGGLLR